MNDGIFTNETAVEVPPKPSYDGTVSSTSFSGEARLTIDTDGLRIDSLFNQMTVLYADISSFALEDYTVHIQAAGEELTVSCMGQKTEWFYRELLAAYNGKVLQALHVEDKPDFEAKGQCAFDGNIETAAIQVFSNCLCVLPPNKNAASIPFIFVNGLKKEAYALTVILTTGEQFTFSMLGYDLDPLEKQIADHIRKQKETNVAFIQKLDASLSFSESVKAAHLLPEGIAVSIEQLHKVNPSLIAVLEKKIQNSKMSETYGQLKKLCNAELLAVGIKALPDKEVEALKEALLEKLNENAEEAVELTAEQEDALRWILWAAIPSKDSKTAVVEFAFPNEDAATYIFRTNGDFAQFMTILNRGLEATQLAREVFSLTEEELQTEKQADARKIVERTSSLQLLRGLFIGRAIHRGAENWKKGVEKYVNPVDSGKTNSGETAAGMFCTNCGARLTHDMKFCGGCGTKI